MKKVTLIIPFVLITIGLKAQTQELDNVAKQINALERSYKRSGSIVDSIVIARTKIEVQRAKENKTDVETASENIVRINAGKKGIQDSIAVVTKQRYDILAVKQAELMKAYELKHKK